MVDAKISFRCPGCDEFIGFPGSEAGTIQECPDCGGWVDVPELVRDPDRRRPLNYHDSDPNEESARQLAEGGRQLEESKRMMQQNFKLHQEWERQMEQSARYQNLADDTFRRFADLVSRWENLTSRIEQKLDPNG